MSDDQQEDLSPSRPTEKEVKPPPLRKYGNLNDVREAHSFYAVGNMATIFVFMAQNNADSFELIALEGEQFPDEVRDKRVSLILSGGRASGVYSIFMIRGLEKKGFLLGKGVVKYFTYERLMNDVDSSKSRRFNRCLACCEGYVILEMEDEELYIFEIVDEVLKPFKLEKKVKLIAHNMMSSTVAVYFTDHTLRIVDLTNDNKLGNEIELINNSPIKVLAKYAADLFIFVHQDDSMYIYRNDEESDGFVSIPDNVTTQIKTEFSSPIKQLVAGYSHFVVLLEDGKCYTRGMNNYGQIDGKMGGEGSTVTHFHPILHNIGTVLSVNCSSLSTTLETESEIVLVGEVSQTFQKLSYPYCQGMNSFWVHRKEFSDETTSFGPWHGFIYRASFHNLPCKTLQYFKNNLRMLVKVPKLSDISIQ